MKKQFLTNTLLILVSMATQQLVGSQNQIVSPVIQLMNKIKQLENKEKRLPINPLDELKKLVKQRVNLNEINPETKNTLLHHAVNHDHKEAAEFLLKNGALLLPNKSGETPLHRAANQGNLGMCKLLVQYSTDVLKDINTQTARKTTPLMEAADCCDYGKGNKGNHLEVVKYLIDKGADTSMKDNQGNNVVMHAGSIPVLEYLTKEKGLSLNTTNTYNETLLHRAASFGHKDLVDYLIKNGLSVTARNIYDATPLLLVGVVKSEAPAIIELLLSAGANINERDVGGWNLFSSAVFSASHDNHTKLHVIFSFLDFLITKGAQVDQESLGHFTTINCMDYSSPKSKALITYLVKKGVKINHVGPGNNTPLYKALNENLPEIALHLMALGADWSINSGDDKTVFAFAEENCPRVLPPLIEAVYAQLTGEKVKLPFKRPVEKEVLQAFSRIFTYGYALPRKVQGNTLESVCLKFVKAVMQNKSSKQYTLTSQEKSICKQYFTMEPCALRELVVTPQKQLSYLNNNMKTQAKTLFNGFNKKMFQDIKFNK